MCGARHCGRDALFMTKLNKDGPQREMLNVIRGRTPRTHMHMHDNEGQRVQACLSIVLPPMYQVLSMEPKRRARRATTKDAVPLTLRREAHKWQRDSALVLATKTVREGERLIATLALQPPGERLRRCGVLRSSRCSLTPCTRERRELQNKSSPRSFGPRSVAKARGSSHTHATQEGQFNWMASLLTSARNVSAAQRASRNGSDSPEDIP